MLFINWLIHLLGGWTREEYDFLEKQFNNHREIVTNYRAREERLFNEIKQEREDRKFLQDILFKKFGIIDPPERLPEKLEEYKPINSKQRWSNLKSRLERDDWERVRQGV